MLSKLNFKVNEHSLATTTQPPRSQISRVSSVYEEDFVLVYVSWCFCHHMGHHQRLGVEKNPKKRQETPFTEQYFALRIDGHQSKS